MNNNCFNYRLIYEINAKLLPNRNRFTAKLTLRLVEFTDS